MIHPFQFFCKIHLARYNYVNCIFMLDRIVSARVHVHIYTYVGTNRQNYIMCIASLSIQNSSEMFACFNGLQIINILAIII